MSAEAPRFVYTNPLENDSSGAKIMLSQEYLQVKHGNQHRAWSWEHISKLALETRKLWFPLIAGGIVATLCFVALFTTYKYPWWFMTGTVIGTLAAYYGWQNRTTLVVHEPKHHTDFILANANEELDIAVLLANRIAIRYPQPIGEVRLPVSEANIGYIQEFAQLELKDKTRLYWPEERLPEGSVAVLLHPLDRELALTFEVLPNQKLRPYISGKIEFTQQPQFIAI